MGLPAAGVFNATMRTRQVLDQGQSPATVTIWLAAAT